jgi:hypothetical protein
MVAARCALCRQQNDPRHDWESHTDLVWDAVSSLLCCAFAAMVMQALAVRSSSSSSSRSSSKSSSGCRRTLKEHDPMGALAQGADQR